MDINNTFTYHSPKNDQPERYENIRENAKLLANIINDLCPDSAEKTIAFRKLQECVMYANASIAINE